MQRFADLPVRVFNLDAPRKISPAALCRVRRLIRSFDPQIVHTHLLRADLYGGLAARLAKVPVVLSSVYAVGSYRRDKVRRLDGLLDRMCRRLATDALAVSEAVRADLIERLGWPADRVNVVRTGTTFPDESPDQAARRCIRQEWRAGDSAPLVLTIARLSYEKGIDVLIRSAGIVHRELPTARFVVLGEGPLKSALDRQIRDLGLTGVVHLAGFRPDVDAALAAADLFVLPSLMEGMPNAILEAYAAGRPVVATSAGGSSEAVDHERSGILVPPHNAEALASAVVRVLRDEPLRRRLGRAGRAWARERFSIERVVGRYETLYERLYRARVRAAPPSIKDSLLRGPVTIT